jgi:hypothetical protein
MNWLGLAGGICTICLIAASVFVPWWVLTVGDDLVKANVSPIYADFNLIGDTFTVPLLFAINLATILTLAAGGIAMLVYSIKPTKTYSKRLLGFGYLKPFLAVILFVAVLFALQQIIRVMISLDVPISGSVTSVLPQSQTYGTIVTILISADFQWPFYLAILTAALCLAARFYHKKIVPTTTSTSTVKSSTSIETTSTMQ